MYNMLPNRQPHRAVSPSGQLAGLLYPLGRAKNGMVAEITDWRAESLRATAFYNTNETVSDAAQVWEAVTGRSPESVSSRPRESVNLAEGNFENNNLVVSRQPDRVDLILRAIPPRPNVPIEGFITLGPFLHLFTPFLDMTKKWLRTAPDLSRLAFGSVLLMEAESVRDGNEAMNQLLPSVQVDAAGSTDFFYQINRRRRSAAVTSMLVNRLTKWSVIQGGTIDVSAGGTPGPANLTWAGILRVPFRVGCKYDRSPESPDT